MIHGLRWRWIWELLPTLLLLTGPALGQEGPEQLEQIEPGRGEWQAEYYGAFGGAGEQSVELLLGMSGKLALGAEIEFSGPREGLRFEAIGPVLLYRAIDPDVRPIGIGVVLHASIGGDGSFQAIEMRAIIERRTRDWWLQSDLILRHANDDGSHGTGLAYAASVQRSLGSGTWLGFEASGQVARLDGATALAPAGRDYAGPSLTTALPIGGSEVELGLAWLQRLRGNGAGSGTRIFAQFAF